MKSLVHHIPACYKSMTPYLVMNNAKKAIEFYKTVFDAEEKERLEMPDGKIGHAELIIGDSILMLAEEAPSCGALAPETVGGTPVSIELYVEGVDAVIQRALDAKAVRERLVGNQFYGDRSGSIKDPFGHRWNIARHIEDVTPEEMEKRSSIIWWVIFQSITQYLLHLTYSKMNPKTFCLSMIMFGSLGAWGENDDFPVVPADFEVRVFAQEPLVRNPCAITFDAQGRLFVGMGPQYRRPTPEMEGDSVFILIDADQDGVADERKTFAKGLNSIQGMAWRGNQLWIANSPDLTVVKDLDGDDEADEYLRLFTDLGNIEHGLHGLNWAPDGKLYMSKGNSKGLNNAPDRIAPKAFRELWGMGAPEGTPDFPKPRQFTKATYKSTFHDPDDDWGLNGGILRCNPDGSGLEIVSRGLRNPWDIAFDSQFNWIGTDNDQNLGDKIFSPFYSANYGWGHPWSYDWLGDDHLPSAPSAGPLFEGSGTGVIFSDIDGYPEHYKGVYFINDWLNREIYIYRPDWKGAWMRPLDEMWSILASAGTGRTMESSAGRRFDPVDIEIGPDGAIYVSSWGRQYGSVLRGGSMVNEGRIYKLWPKSFDFVSQESPNDPFSTINPTMELLILHLGSHLPARRVDAQNALVRSGKIAIPALQKALLQAKKDSALETWLLWTLGRIGVSDRSLDSFFQKQWEGTFNRRIQTLRIVAFQARERRTNRFPAYAASGLRDEEARLRHASVLGLHQTMDTQWNEELLRLIQYEDDRLVYYSAWQAMRDLLTKSQQKELLKAAQPSVRRAALLSLLEDDALADNEIRVMTRDADVMTSILAQKRLGGKAAPVIKGPAISAQIGNQRKQGNRSQPEDLSSAFVVDVVLQLEAESGRTYEQATLLPGSPAYTDRSYRLLEIPNDLVGETFIRTANNDADFTQGAGMQFELMFPSTVFVADDMRGEKTPNWLAPAFQSTDLFLKTEDAKHRLYKAQLPAGLVQLGSNKEGVSAPKAGYIVIVKPEFLQTREASTRVSDVDSLLGNGDASRGRTLFHQIRAANCSACHQLEGQGNAFAPDLKDIGNRAKPEMIVRSILEPSAEITEGFVSQSIETKHGDLYEGLIVSESGRVITLANAAGQTVDVSKAEITTRKSSKMSAMPGGLGDVLSPLQVADLVAYLMNLQPGGKQSDHQVDSSIKSVDDLPETTHSSKQDDVDIKISSTNYSFKFIFLEDGVEVQLGDQSIARYYHQHPEVHRPFWAHVKTPSGKQVTRHYPPVEGVDAMDHPHMHPGLSMGFAVLNGVNFWHNREGRVVHRGYQNVVVTSEKAVFSTHQVYLDGSGHEICEEKAQYSFRVNEDGYLLMWDTRLESMTPFYFGVKEEMGLTLRVAAPLVVKSGQGRIFASHGGKNEAGTWGKVADWWDYSGLEANKFLGVQLMSGPGNPKVWSHSRDYGVLVANPFPVDVNPNRDLKTSIEPGSPLQLHFGIQVHEHARMEDYNPDRVYRHYLEWATKE